MRRAFVLLVSSLLLLGATGWLVAQAPAPPREEEDDSVKVVRPRKPLRDDEDNTKAVTPRTPPPEAVANDAVIDLEVEARTARHPVVKKLYEQLAFPFDRIYEIVGEETRVMPLAVYLGDQAAPFREDVLVVPLSEQNKRGLRAKIDSRKIKFVRHYEQIVLRACDDFLKLRLENELSNTPNHLSRYDQLAAVEKAYAFAARWHAAAVERRERDGDGWRDLGRRLQQALLESQLEQLQVLADAKDRRGDDVAARLAMTFPDSPQVQKQVLAYQIRRAENSLKSGDDQSFLDVRRNLETLRRVYAGGNEAGLEEVQRKLRAKADSYFREAQELVANKQQAAALAKLEAAERIDPEHRELRNYRLKLTGAYPILYVGVPRLPDLMSPAKARTDAERWAVDLLFEGLVQAVPDRNVGVRYQVELAARLPAVRPMAREVVLPPEAGWADGSPVLAGDILDTLRLARQLPAGSALAEEAAVFDLDSIQVRDARRLRLPLTRGLLDPLGALSFKVVPAQHLINKGLKLDDDGFARQPFGSGPYIYRGREDAPAGPQAVFLANPTYANRPEHRNRPYIREIRLVPIAAEPAAEIKLGKLHALIGVPTDLVVKLRSPESGLGNQIVIARPPHRRIHLLAINHRTRTLQKLEVRRALMTLIDRETILQDVYRAGQPEFHKALVGPFPPSATWAIPPDTKPLFDANLAKGLLGKAGVSPAQPLTVTLTCPNDPFSVQACEAIRNQAEQLGAGLVIDVKPTAPESFRSQVEVIHDFDLAYTTFDYSDNQLSLAGLLGSQSLGGRNYLGFSDPRFDSLLGRIREHRDFEPIRTLVHTLHNEFVNEVPFVPLWQLDQHIVLRTDVKPLPVVEWLDPLRPFSQIAQWQLGK